MQAVTIPPLTEMLVGICVTTEFCVYRGRNSYKATHQRDAETKWQVVIASPCDGAGHEAALTAWMQKFTGVNGDGFIADLEVTARASEYGVCRWTLSATRYN